MAKNIFTVTDRNGTIHKRTSESRTYTHAVVARPSYEAAISRLDNKALEKINRNNFAYHMAYVNGTSQWLERDCWESEQQHQKRTAREIARSVDALEGCKTADEYVAMVRRFALDRIEGAHAIGFYDTFQCVGWCGRLDLAHKLASELP
jgi:hypothetical protein